jgi:hypothetical protein
MNLKQQFIDIFNGNITRQGASDLLKYLLSDQSDFFEAPASTRYHLAYPGGLLEHSLNVYRCLKDYLSRESVRNAYQLIPSEETIAIVALLHDLCKINVYQKSFRNVKDEQGKWSQVPSYDYQDKLPYGHGGGIGVYHLGFHEIDPGRGVCDQVSYGLFDTEDKNNVGRAFEMFPLAFALSTADMEATYFLEGNKE